jgi:aerobic carbon-monoxide dehydrogenase small subunit
VKNDVHLAYSLKLSLNQQERQFTIDSSVLLVDLIRDHANLTGTHVGCDTAQCGACTVLVDGYSVKSCNVLALQVQGQQVTTIEGTGTVDRPSIVQTAFSQACALQCGYCTPGMIMRTHEILSQTPVPFRGQIARELEGNLCRCTGYTPIIEAIESLCKSA